MSLATKTQLSESSYLKGELDAQLKHELVEGEAFAMAGASEKHNTISGNIFAGLFVQLKGSLCKPFIADMKVGVQGDFYYPDVMVVCEEHQNDTEYVKYAPKLIVEVLSKSTRAFDHSIKLEKYLKITSLEYYVIIEQDYCEVSVFSRAAGFISKFYHLGDEIHFSTINVSIISLV